ncbi:hypothetical protein CK203_106256 [Vitis vinifera]|uniref:Uncharacterized protein n=1 Tax=Vitis vinifera TaxID=29760 RepID=A0A438FHH2_VITVI|nr:hypothetical protein CK203_106256 [Vitis vinifera]
MSWYSGSQAHSTGPAHSLRASTSSGLSSLDSSFPERHSSYFIQRGIHTPVSVEEGAPSQQEEAAQSGCHSTSLPRLLCQILEHLGYPFEPQLERRRILREIFTLDKWMSMTAYDTEPGAPDGPEHPKIPHPEEPQPVEIPADMRALAPAVPSTEPIPEVAPSAPPATPQTPPVIQSISEPPPSSEPRIAISISEYRGLCHTLQALTTS